MSSDLLAEFDSFYNPSSKPNAPTNPTPASHDLSFFGNTNQQNQYGQGGSQWQSQPAPAPPSDDIWGGMSGFQSNTNAGQTNTAQDDLWGSFEAAKEPVKAPTQSYPPPAADYGAFTMQNHSQPAPGIVRRPTLDLFSNNSQNDAFSSQPSTKSQRLSPVPATPPQISPGDVLFDAEEELPDEADDDDDFGDFETVTSPEPPPPSKPVQFQPQSFQSLDSMFGATTLEPKTPSKKPQDLLSTSLNSGGLPYPQAPKSPSFQDRNPFGNLGLSMKPVEAVRKDENPKTASPVTAWPSFQVPVPEIYRDSPAVENQPDDDWGDFADLPAETTAKAAAKSVTKAATGIEADAWGWDAADQVTSPPPPTNISPPSIIPPPSNIPPPSVLLSLFPPLFDLPRTHLFTPVSTQPFSLKNRILSDPTTLTFLKSFLSIATVSAHILAGRKSRWKRDTLLSQAMKMGPGTGMKLAGIDKAEITREDREAADVVRIWKEQVGRLRSAVAVANSRKGEQLVVPEVGEIVVRVEGRPGREKQCVVCGLRREERVRGVDEKVEDSFGEWWVEFWGHRTCRNFWVEHEGDLRHR